MTVLQTPKMSPIAQKMLATLMSQSEQLNANTEADTLIEKRQQACRRLSEVGFPTRKDEDWQYTSLVPFFQHDFAIKSAATELDFSAIKPFLPSFETIRLVFVDGVFSESLSAGFDHISDDFSIEMAEADAIQNIRLRTSADAFELQNEMLLDEGISLHLGENGVLPVPMHLLYVQTQAEQLVNVRAEVQLEANAQMTLVQQFVSLSEGRSSYINFLNKIILAENANFKQVVLQNLNEDSFYFANQYIEQQERSALESLYVALGSQIARHQNYVALKGSFCESDQNSIVLGGGKQVLDARTETQHLAPDCNSRQLHKFVLNDVSRGVFNGMIFVDQIAQKTDGQMDNKNLLLSNQAKMDTKPLLEIYADDVKCSHGCASGQIDDNQVFYAQARGIRQADAVKLITQAFLLEPLDSMSNVSVQQWLTSLVTKCLNDNQS